MNTSEKNKEEKEPLGIRPNCVMSGIEGKGILTHSSTEFSPEVTRIGILSKTPNLPTSKTSYANKPNK